MRLSFVGRLAGLLLVSWMLACGGPASVAILSPANGTFVSGTSVTVTLQFARANTTAAQVNINGVPVTGFPVNGPMDVVVPIDPVAIFNPIVVELTQGPTHIRERITVVAVDDVNTAFVPDGSISPQAVGMRIGNTGLDQITPVIESLSSGSLDVANLITDQNPIASGSMLGINYTANAVEVGFTGFGMSAAAATGQIDTDIQIDGFFVEIDLELGFLGSCTLEIESSSTNIVGGYDLEPLASDPSLVDVNLITPISVVLGGFTSQFVSGVCNDPIIGDIINLIMGPSQLQALVEDGFETNLADPDGAGPLDSPLAEAIQTALAGISIAGPLGTALGGTFTAPIDSIDEDPNGITLVVDAAITQGTFHPESPDLPGSLGITETFPSFGPTTPVGALPYGLAFGISSTAMNQLLKAQIEGGLMVTDLTELELFGQQVPLTVAVLSVFVPELQTIYPALDPMEIRLRPQLAPVFTGNPGGAGELAELRLAGLLVQIVHVPSGDTPVELEVDVDLGVDLVLGTEGLSFTVGVPGSIGITVVTNDVNTNEANLVSTMQNVFPLLADTLGSALGSFPFPSLLGMGISSVEISRMGTFLGVFADLVVTPTSEIQNAVLTDMSAKVEGYHDGLCWIGEYRHRTASLVLGNTIRTNLRGMLGADAGCTTNDQTFRAQNLYRLDFDVVGVAGEQWTLDIDHSILGAFTIYDESNVFGDGGGTAEFETPIYASVLMDGVVQPNFDITPSVMSVHHPISGSQYDSNVEFSGSNSTQIVGTGNATFQLEFRFDMRSFSNSNVVFPAITGDEVGIRFGKNDTIDNNFTAGQYPGTGSRNISEDGHESLVTLTATPIP